MEPPTCSLLGIRTTGIFRLQTNNHLGHRVWHLPTLRASSDYFVQVQLATDKFQTFANVGEQGPQAHWTVIPETREGKAKVCVAIVH